jgi:hypothetical protein
MKGAERGFLFASVAAIGLAVARAYLLEVEDVDAVSQASATEKPTPPERPDRSAPACPSSTTPIGFDRVIETPDTTLSDLPPNGWFLVNNGTETDPVYQLGRLYADGTVKLGPLVDDLTLLGPDSVPEVSKSEIFDPFDQYHLSKDTVPEYEMDVWYVMPTENYRQPDSYGPGIERRSMIFNAPYEVGSRRITDGEVRTVRDVLFESVDYNKSQPEVTQDGAPCSRSFYADASFERRSHGTVIATNEYPLLHELSPEMKEWVRAHELGHALALAVYAEDAHNALPLEERKQILEELRALHEALRAAGKPTSLNTPREAIANVYAYLMKDPAFVKGHAPHAAQFFGGLVNDHPSLSRILSFK